MKHQAWFAIQGHKTKNFAKRKIQANSTRHSPDKRQEQTKVTKQARDKSTNYKVRTQSPRLQKSVRFCVSGLLTRNTHLFPAF